MIRKSLLFLFLAFALFAPGVHAQSIIVGSTQTVMTPTQRTTAGLPVWPDGNMGAVLSSGTDYLFAPNGAADNTQGLTSVDLNNLQSNLMLINTTMNIPKGGAGSFAQNYAGGGVVTLNGTTLVHIFHGEYWYSPPSGSPFYAGLGLAFSNDFGVTWNVLGQVISPQTTRTGNCQVDTGVGTLVPLTIGGIQYLGIYYVDEGAGCNGGDFNIALAVGKVSDVMAAITANVPFTSGPGTLFKKLSGGSFSQNGVTDLANPAAGGGSFDSLTTGNQFFTPNVAFDSYIGQYVMTYSNLFSDIEIRLSPDGINWSGAPTVIASGGTPGNGLFYPTLFNTNGGDPMTLGQQFWVYYIDHFPTWTSSDLLRTSVSFGGGTDIYISQSGTGGGTSCSDTLSAAFFNTSGNWGGGHTIFPGVTVHVCGTITTTLGFQGSGTSGSVIQLLAEPGAILSQAAGIKINLNGQSWIKLNGGLNGIIRNTANGVNLANQAQTQAIFGSGAGNIEVTNWTFADEYDAVPPVAATGFDESLSNAYYANGTAAGTISIHDNVIHDVGWAILIQGPATGTVENIFNNYLYNINHGFSSSGANQFTANVSSNHFGAMANWDTSTGNCVGGGVGNCYHHDSVHLYGSFNSATKYNIWSNLYDQNDGVNNTAHIFIEDGVSGITDFNEVHIQYPGNYLNDGFVTATNGFGTSLRFLSDTYVGDPTVNGMSCTRLGGSALVVENSVYSGCNNLISVEAGSTVTIDHNTYANQGTGGNSRWNWEASGPTNTFATWQSECGCDANSSYQTSAGFDANGVPMGGSPLLGAGANLTSLGIAALNSDTSAGNSRTPSARPTSGNWTIGAYQNVSGGTPIVSLSPSPLAFGGVNVGNNSTQTITLTNTGSATLTGSIGISGTYYTIVGGGSCSTSSLSVTAASSCTLNVKFTPLVTGAQSGTVTYTTNASSSPDHVTLSGTGLAPVPAASISGGEIIGGEIAQ